MPNIFEDESNEPFDPFNVGPPNYGRRCEIIIPTCPTYPPPAYAYFPPPKDHTNTSVSQGSMAKTTDELQKTKSQLGMVDVSKAINEEMAAAKQQAAAAEEKQRIDAGGVSQTALPAKSSAAADSHTSIKTLLDNKTRLHRSPSSKTSVASSVSKKGKLTAPSKLSVGSIGKPLDATATSAGLQQLDGKLTAKQQANCSTITLKSGVSVKGVGRAKASRPELSESGSKAANLMEKASVISQTLKRGSKQLADTLETVTQNTLLEQSNELRNRLRAGDDDSQFRRCNVIHKACTNREPEKRFQGTRMTVMYKDDVLT